MKPLRHALRWIGRIGSLGCLALILLFLVGEGCRNFTLNAHEFLLFLCFPVSLCLGLMLAWRCEIAGALLALGGIAGFYALHYASGSGFPQGPWFFIIASPALFFLLSGLMRPKS